MKIFCKFATIMRATIEFVQAKVDYFNDLCFGGELPPIPIVLTSARTFLGKVTYMRRRGLFGRVVGNSDFTLRISTSFDLSESELEDVIIHELIHYYIASRNLKDTSAHGETFRQMMSDINARFGRNVVLRHQGLVGERPVRASRTPDLLCVTRLDGGGWGVTRCTEAMAPKLRRTLPRYFHIAEMTWFRCRDPFFDRFPRSRTPKIYKISRADLDAHLQLLERV